jgi:hypothetical protein
MKSENLMVVAAVVAVVISLIGLATTYNSISSLKQKFTGYYASNEGYINLTVESSAQINFSVFNINWSSGKVTAGYKNATLDTSTGTITNGNWTGGQTGFIVQNIGNVNVSINLSGSKTAATLLGGTGPAYMINVSVNQTGACNTTQQGAASVNVSWNFSQWANVTTDANTRVCGNFTPYTGQNSIRIDVYLRIPEDSMKGLLSDVLTARFYQI